MSIKKLLDPKNDVAFRRIFGSEKNKDILIQFLNDMLVVSSPITDVVFLKTVQDPEIAAKKTSVVDVLCKDQADNSYVVEMQVAKEKGFEKRAIYYASKAYAAQLNVQGKYHTLKDVIFLAITNFVMFKDKEAYKSDHVILDKESFSHDLKGLSFTFLELPKFSKTLSQASTMIEKWAYFFKHAEETDFSLSEFVTEKGLSRAYEQLDRFSWTEEELLAYEQVEKQEADYIASLDQKYDEGIEKGKAQGKAEGLAEGETKGLLKKAQEVARMMISKGFDDVTVSEMTGLSLSEIQALRG